MHKLGDIGISVRQIYASYPLWVLPRLLKSSYFGWLYDYHDFDGDDDDDDDDDDDYDGDDDDDDDDDDDPDMF